MLVVVVHKETCGHDVSSSILQIYDAAIFYSHLLSSRNITQIKYQKLVFVHSHTLVVTKINYYTDKWSSKFSNLSGVNKKK